MPTSTSNVKVNMVFCGGNVQAKEGVSQSLSGAAIAVGDFLGRDANGKIGNLFAESSSNQTSSSTTVIAGVSHAAYPTTTAVNTIITYIPAENEAEFVIPIVDSSNVPLAWSQAYEGHLFTLRRVQNDDALTNLRNRYVAVYAASPTASDCPLLCVRRDPDSYQDDYAYGIFRVRESFVEV